MKKIFTAETPELAMEAAAAEFGVAADRITFNVIEQGKKGILGIGRVDAQVEAEYEPSKRDVAIAYLTDVLRSMGAEVTLEAEETEDGLKIEIIGDTSGNIIGRRGETLDALQYLTSMAANKSDREYYRISLDSCGYRDKRKTALEELTAKISKTVLRTGRPVTLEPMNPYERRIIHAAVSNIEGVSSKSIGEEPYRKVVISSDNPRRDSRGGRGNRGDRRDGHRDDFKNSRRRGERKPTSMDLNKTSFEREYKRPKLEESDLITGDLYGKIEI